MSLATICVDSATAPRSHPLLLLAVCMIIAGIEGMARAVRPKD